MEEFRTTGTRGTPRSIYWPVGTKSEVSSLIREAINANTSTAIYAAAIVETDIFLRAHIEGLIAASPTTTIRDFATAVDVAAIVRESDAIILFDYPSALPRFLRLTQDAIDAGILSIASIQGKSLTARLTGEPMNSSDLNAWHSVADALGLLLRTELRYGCTEFLGIGKSDFLPDYSNIEYLLTGHDCFAEVLDPATLEPIHEGRGVLCGTSFRTSGTILYRYLLGDDVEIFEREGARYIRNIGRPDALIVTGNTVSLSDLVYQLRSEIGLEVCLDVRKRIDPATAVQHLEVVVYVPTSPRGDHMRVRTAVEARILDELKIRPKLDGGFIKLEVHARTLGVTQERRRKAWRML